ncbi:MAG: 50S ribosomal protein L31e [Candidatus Nanoarchaeia archaeon]
MAKTERNYTIPLRKNFAKVPKYYRSKRAINHIKAFIVRHMKVAEEDIKLGKNLNEKVWMHGIKNPPGKVKVKVVKENNKLTVELEGFEYKIDKVQTEKTEKATSLKDKLTEKLASKEEKKEDANESSEAAEEKKPKVVRKKASPKKEEAVAEE